MKKILIVDNDEMLMKLLAKKISKSLGFEVDTTSSAADIRALASDDYLLCFAEWNFTSQNGDLLDFLLSQNFRVVLVSANNDKNFKQECLKKDILAFLHKENALCVEQMLLLIKNVSAHQNEKLILAMSKLNERNELKKMLNLWGFKVLAAAHGEEALSYLADNVDTKLIVCDAKMPVIDAFALMSEVRENYAESNIDFIVLNEKDESVEAEFLNANASEVLTKPFGKELFNARLEKFFKAKEQQKLVEIFADFEPKTGAKTTLALKNDFDDYLREIKNLGEEFAFALVEIDDLQAYKDEYGVSVSDELIKSVVKAARDECLGKDIVGHISFERICIVLKSRSQELAMRVLNTICENIKARSVLVSLDEVFFSVCMGVSFGKSQNSFNELNKKAENALKIAQTSGKDRIELCL